MTCRAPVPRDDPVPPPPADHRDDLDPEDHFMVDDDVRGSRDGRLE